MGGFAKHQNRTKEQFFHFQFFKTDFVYIFEAYAKFKGLKGSIDDKISDSQLVTTLPS